MTRSTVKFNFAGKDMIADAAGALIWPEESTLIVSDLHLEKGSSFAQKVFRHLPPYDTGATLQNLAVLIDRYRPQRVICLGDSFHDDTAVARMQDQDAAHLNLLMKGRDWIWITGNHDPALPPSLGGRIEATLVCGALKLLHKAEGAAPYELSGHYHPKAAIMVQGAYVSGRCFVIDHRHLIIPAFGAFTGGLSVRDPAIASLLSPHFTVAMIGRQRIVRLPGHRLIG